MAKLREQIEQLEVKIKLAQKAPILQKAAAAESCALASLEVIKLVASKLERHQEIILAMVNREKGEA